VLSYTIMLSQLIEYVLARERVMGEHISLVLEMSHSRNLVPIVSTCTLALHFHMVQAQARFHELNRIGLTLSASKRMLQAGHLRLRDLICLSMHSLQKKWRHGSITFLNSDWHT
jgi:hypothetical protein